jgi:hypothetical protein
MKWKPHHKMKRPPDESTHKHKDMETLYILMIILVFLDLKRVNVCEHAIKMASYYLTSDLPRLCTSSRTYSVAVLALPAPWVRFLLRPPNCNSNPYEKMQRI